MLQLTLVYLLPTAFVLVLYVWYRQRSSAANRDHLQAAIAGGLDQPASLHPRIDPARCIGCGSCVSACPERTVLGLINQRAVLIEAANCIGHGACQSACPMGAIQLVFGTATRGIEIPHLKPDFETSVPGIYIAGELGGMGLVRNAAEQGKQAVASIKKALPSHTCDLDLLIIGAGPAGIAASLAAQRAQLNYQTIDQDSLGGTVAHFPRRKVVMTQPVDLPLVGKVRFRETSKESLLAFWQEVVNRHRLGIRFGERLLAVNRGDEGFVAHTTAGQYSARMVLLCLGRRGTPRQLGVPGEDLEKVVYRLQDPTQYRDQRILVVGGGDSAVEAAVTLAEAGASVTMSYRGGAFNRVKPRNREALDQAVAAATVELRLGSEVTRITPTSVSLRSDGVDYRLDNDAVIVCAGGILPKQLLDEMGVAFETKYGSA